MGTNSKRNAFVPSLVGLCLCFLLGYAGFCYYKASDFVDSASRKTTNEILFYRVDFGKNGNPSKYDKPDIYFEPQMTKTLSGMTTSQLGDIAVLCRQTDANQWYFLENRLRLTYKKCLELLSNSSEKQEAMIQLIRIQKAELNYGLNTPDDEEELREAIARFSK